MAFEDQDLTFTTVDDAPPADGSTVQAGGRSGSEAMDAALARMTGIQKSAILLVSLGTARAGEVMKHLGDEDVEALAQEMAKTTNVPPEAVNVVMEEVVETAMARGYLRTGGPSYTRDVLEQRFGEEKAAEIMARLQVLIESKPFRFLARTPPDQIYNSIRREHPQTIAVIMAHLSERQGAAVLSFFEPSLQADITRRIATMRQISPKLIADIEQVVRSRMFSIMNQESSKAGGVEQAAKIITQADRQTERNIFEGLEGDEEGKELAEEIRKLLFVFEDIGKLDGRAIQLILRNVDQNDLALALRMANDQLRELIYANMSERAGEQLRENIELMPPQRRREIEEAQTRIVAVVRALEAKGEIVIFRTGEEDEVV